MEAEGEVLGGVELGSRQRARGVGHRGRGQRGAVDGVLRGGERACDVRDDDAKHCYPCSCVGGAQRGPIARLLISNGLIATSLGRAGAEVVPRGTNDCLRALAEDENNKTYPGTDTRNSISAS